ncbi:MAG: hypothetical protein ABI120_14185 [Gemmatimonadaceae bacterium]
MLARRELVRIGAGAAQFRRISRSRMMLRTSRTAIGVPACVAAIAGSTFAAFTITASGFAAAAIVAATLSVSALGAQQVVRLIDSVLVKEFEGTSVSSIGTMANGPNGDVFVSDLAEGRIIPIAANGNIVGTFASKGKGPGELTTAGLRTEGVTPEFLKNNPRFIRALNQSALAIRENDVWSASEYSQSLYNWKRGTTIVAQELKLSVVNRRGVDEGVLLQVLRDPEKSAALLYDHSSPIALRFIAPELLALVTMDPKFEPPTAHMRNGKFTGQHHVTPVDVKTKRICPNNRLPVVDDPLPRVAFVGDVLVVLQQASLKNGDAATALRRFKIDPQQCPWKPL